MSVDGISSVRGSISGTELQFYTQVTPVQKPVVPPAGLDVRLKILEKYGIKVMDSDVSFSRGELVIIEETLEKISKREWSHLKGVKKIIKNKKSRVALKKRQIHAEGAYDEATRTIYIFDGLKDEAELEKVLTHEIGHAVNYYNLLFEKFMEFVRINSWNIVEFRQIFIPGNALFNIATQKRVLTTTQWRNVWNYFTLNSLAERKDTSGELFLEPKEDSVWKDMPAQKNPLEQFATFYEIYLTDNEFLKKASEKNEIIQKDYQFFEREVFNPAGFFTK
jgi:hypothetical protein